MWVEKQGRGAFPYNATHGGIVLKRLDHKSGDILFPVLFSLSLTVCISTAPCLEDMVDGYVLLHVYPSQVQVLKKPRIMKAEVMITDIAFPCLAAGHLQEGSWG